MKCSLFIVLAALAFAGSAFAQQQQTCPVAFEKVDPTAVVFGTSDPWGWELRIKYKNVSSKEIVAEKFGANFLDVTMDKRSSAWNYTASERVKPGQSKAPHWSDGVYVNEMGLRLNAEAWLQKAVFADGSMWEDDGSHSCSATSMATKQQAKK